MAKKTGRSPTILRLIAAPFASRPDALLLLIALSYLLSLLSRHLPVASAAPLFEGFDSDEIDDNADEDASSDTIEGSTTILDIGSPPLTQSSSESHRGTPSPFPSSSLRPAEVSRPSSSDDFWDEDEFEGIPVTPYVDIVDRSEEPPVDTATEFLHSSDTSEDRLPPSTRSLVQKYTVEIACVSFLVVFAINYFTGKRENELIALAWASKFATKDSIFEKNFSLLGTGDGKDSPLLLKEGNEMFKFWASGRRYCKGLLATMELRSRHDLISRIMDVVFRKKDTITFEVMMADDAMDHVVLAVARKKTARAMHKETRDLQKFASIVASAPVGRKWVADDLAVVAESKEVAGDLIAEVVLDQVLGEKSFDKFGRGFISLHFSDQHPGAHKKMLIFKFTLPRANDMADMTRLVTLVPYYIDLMGRYKLSTQARLKTETARTKAAQEAYKELQNARQEEFQKRKAEKKKLLEEAQAKLSAEAIRKREEKERARQAKKSAPRIKMMRSN